MMRCGVSTACFYPRDTCASLQTLRNAGVHTAEIFLNTFSELNPEYVEALERIKHDEMRIVALHPFTSAMETFFFASMYEGRFDDGLRIYRRYFEICRMLDIPRCVFHGDNLQTPYPFKKHCENYLRLRRAAREYGVDFCQENVVRCKCGRPDYVQKMREYTNDDVSFVLDVKQLRRAQVPVEDMLAAMRGKISHLHLSDADALYDCIAPGRGSFDFAQLATLLRQSGFSGDMVIELYRAGFADMQELCKAQQLIDEYFSANTGGE